MIAVSSAISFCEDENNLWPRPCENPMSTDLDARSREVLQHIVDAYLETGEPVGSRTLSRRLGLSLSPATIRNVMADLMDAGLLYAPHTSAGRLPTDAGLRLFVNGLLEISDLSVHERAEIAQNCTTAGKSLDQALEKTTALLSGLSQCAGLVIAPKIETEIRHVEFVHIGPGRALVVLVTEEGAVENRIIDVPLGMPPSTLTIASNYMNARLAGRTLTEAKDAILNEIRLNQAELDSLSSHVIKAGLASWAGGEKRGSLIVRGQSNLLKDITEIKDIDKIRGLFATLETQEGLLQLLDAAIGADGVQIFIGAENQLFTTSGCSLIVAPYTNARDQIVGAIGVIGPTRINYARIIPMVDYTAKVLGRLLSGQHNSKAVDFINHDD